MIDSARRRGSFALLLLAAALFPAACLFDKPPEEVQLTLTRVPAGVDYIQVFAVDRTDTAAVIAPLYAKPWSPGTTLQFSLGRAAGRNWLLRVEGYQGGYLRYLSFIPPSATAADSAVQVPVNRGMPAVFFTGVARDSDTIRFETAFRMAPSGAHWRLDYGNDTLTGSNYQPIATSGFSLPAGAIHPGSLLIADLHGEDRALLPYQDPDTMLADEALSPKGSAVKITEAFRSNDTVHLMLAFANFQEPDVDEAVPGRGFPMVLETSTFRVLPGFQPLGGDRTHWFALVPALDKVKSLAVVLHYANGMRIRPLAADSMETSLALRPRLLVPSVQVDSTRAMPGDSLMVFLTRKNFQGYHVHIYRDFMRWPNPFIYRTCYTSVCKLDSPMWVGARRLIFSVQQDASHELPDPLISDTLSFE
jgi:hypothetical protein